MGTGRANKNRLGIYTHIPYCTQKCPYCSFNSYQSVEGSIPEVRYMEALKTELSSIRKKEFGDSPAEVETLYFGGGTPSIIDPTLIADFIKFVKSSFNTTADIEITIEANPETITKEKLQIYIDSGINRLSIGTQSFNDKELIQLGRGHDSQKSIESIELAREAGFKNISLDLIFALENQTKESFLYSLEKTISFNPEHISLYGLTIEEGTLFHKKYIEGTLKTQPDDIEKEFYKTAIEVLASNGYEQYELSNFAKANFRSRHNSKYWDSSPYIGLGSGAHSFNPYTNDSYGKRWFNEKDPDSYMHKIEKTGDAQTFTETLTKEEAITERLFLGLRQMDGINIEEFKTEFGMTPEYALTNKNLLENKLIEITAGQLKLTTEGIFLANEVY